MMSPAELNREMLHSLESIIDYLLPNAKRDGRHMVVGSVGGESGKSLRIDISGSERGRWKDFAMPDSKASDLLGLWAEVRCGGNIREALKEVKDYLGIRESKPAFTAPPVKYTKPTVPVKTKVIQPQSEVMEYLTRVRCLSESTIKDFKVCESGHHIVFPYTKSNERFMVKIDSCRRDAEGNRIESPKPTNTNQQPILFGWQALKPDARYVIITEGEIDAMSWHEVGQPALSVPFGGGTGKKHAWLDHEFDDLQMFDEVLLCMDNDDVGIAATLDLINRIGSHKCRVIKGLPTKDVNEALQKGLLTPPLAAELVRDAEHLDPAELKSAHTFQDEVLEMFAPKGEEPGFFSPWRVADNKFKFRPAELSIINGVNGHGKSEVAGHIMLDAMKQGELVCVASMELQPKRLLHRLMSQACAVTGSIPSNKAIITGMNWLRGKMWLFDLTGTAKSDRILEVFEYAHKRYGISVFVVDSLMKCGFDEDDSNGQKLFLEKLCDFKNQFSVHVFLITHSRKVQDEKVPGGKMDVKGTSAITDLADNVFIAFRNKSKEELIEKIKSTGEGNLEEAVNIPDAYFYCHKQRNGEWEGRVSLWFCRWTRQYTDSPSAKPKPYFLMEREISYG